MTRRWAAVLVAVLGVLAIAAHAGADSWVRSVRVKKVLGEVEIDQAKGRGFRSAMAWMPITEGARMKTMPTGRAEVEFEDGSTVRLSPKTEISFSKLMLLSTGDRVSVMDLTSGGVGVNFRRQGSNSVQLIFSGGEVNLDDDSAEFFLQLDESRAKLTVKRGKVKVHQSGQVVVVHKKQTWEFKLLPSEEVAAAHTGAQDF